MKGCKRRDVVIPNIFSRALKKGIQIGILEHRSEELRKALKNALDKEMILINFLCKLGKDREIDKSINYKINTVWLNEDDLKFIENELKETRLVISKSEAFRVALRDYFFFLLDNKFDTFLRDRNLKIENFDCQESESENDKKGKELCSVGLPELYTIGLDALIQIGLFDSKSSAIRCAIKHFVKREKRLLAFLTKFIELENTIEKTEKQVKKLTTINSRIPYYEFNRYNMMNEQYKTQLKLSSLVRMGLRDTFWKLIKKRALQITGLEPIKPKIKLEIIPSLKGKEILEIPDRDKDGKKIIKKVYVLREA